MSRSESWRQRASWVLLVALVATAATVVFVSSNAQAVNTGPIDEDLCTKIDSGLIGVTDTYGVGTTGETVTLNNWVSSGSSFIGFDWNSTHPVNVWVKYSTETVHDESGSTSGSFSNLPNGISNVVVCLGSYESGKIGSD